MPSVEIFIPILPKAQMRDRLTTIKGHAKSFKHEKQRVQEENLRELLYPRLPDQVLWPLKTAVALSMEVHLPIPKGTSKKKVAAMLAGEIRHDKKPDLDNLEKHLLDCCNGVLWEDDKQIDWVLKRKRYSQTPGWQIVVEWRMSGNAFIRQHSMDCSNCGRRSYIGGQWIPEKDGTGWRWICSVCLGAWNIKAEELAKCTTASNR